MSAIQVREVITVSLPPSPPQVSTRWQSKSENHKKRLKRERGRRGERRGGGEEGWEAEKKGGLGRGERGRGGGGGRGE